METASSHTGQQPTGPALQNGVGRNSGVTSLAPGSSVSEVIVIDGEAAPGEEDGALRWCNAGQSMVDQTIRRTERSGDATLTSPKKQPVWTEPAGKGSWFYPPGNAPGTFTGLTTSHAITGDTHRSSRQNINTTAAGQFKHSERTVRVQHPGSNPYTSYPPVNHLSQRPSPNAGPQTYQKHSGHPGQRPTPYAGDQTHINPASMYRPFSCTSCSKCFFVQADLQRHMARHTREKPFVCQVCGKSFVCQSQLQMHVNVHTGARPFSCSICGRRFSHPSNLKRHQKIQH